MLLAIHRLDRIQVKLSHQELLLGHHLGAFLKIIDIKLVLLIGLINAASQDLLELLRQSLATLSWLLKLLDHFGQLLDLFVFFDKLHLQIRLGIRNGGEPILLFS